MIGQCLCSSVQFDVMQPRINIYQCHCSLCRRNTGAAANAGAMVPQDNFRWLSGADNITPFVKDTGYSAPFCSTCGSPVPNLFRQSGLFWIPPGLLVDTDKIDLVAHFHVASKAVWDQIHSAGEPFETMPPIDEIFKMLRS